MLLKYAQSHEVHWTQKYDQEVGLVLLEDYFILCYEERYKIHLGPNCNSNKFN